MFKWTYHSLTWLNQEAAKQIHSIFSVPSITMKTCGQPGCDYWLDMNAERSHRGAAMTIPRNSTRTPDTKADSSPKSDKLTHTEKDIEKKIRSLSQNHLWTMTETKEALEFLSYKESQWLSNEGIYILYKTSNHTWNSICAMRYNLNCTFHAFLCYSKIILLNDSLMLI